MSVFKKRNAEQLESQILDISRTHAFVFTYQAEDGQFHSISNIPPEYVGMFLRDVSEDANGGEQ